MKKRLWQLVVPVAAVILTLVIYGITTREKDDEPDVVRVEKGVFEVVVTGMGELEALESTDIMIPEVLRTNEVRIRQITITDIVKEGTMVKKGDYVATLDPADVEERMRSAEDALELYHNNLENAKIDSSLALSSARDEIRQARDLVTDREIKLEQSIYESAAVQRQAQIALETAQRSLEQKLRNYDQLRRRYRMQVERIEENLADQQEYMDKLIQLKRDLIIRAPANGLVVYARDGRNEKIKVGSRVNRWSARIAMLPNLSTLQAIAYVKEIDIAKIRPGLSVRVSIDAFPEDQFSGVVTRVANIGQEVQGEFYNAFKVEIKVDPSGKELLPGMTTTNNIVVESIRDAVMVPRLAVFKDSLLGDFVYKREGLNLVKQQIKTNGENDLYYMILSGLKPGDKVMMKEPVKKDRLAVHHLEE